MSRARGFTLLEMAMVIVVIGIIAAAVTPLVVSSVNAYHATLNSLGTLDKLRYATERLARELREVAYDGTNYAITMSSTAPVFTKADGVIVTLGTSGASPNMAVTLNYSGTAPSVSPAPWLTDQVRTIDFTYLDQNGMTPVTAATVRYVVISLTLTQGSQDYSQVTRVELRNR